MATVPVRPQVSIDRLPSSTRHVGRDQRETMNCKSCRQRKIKCNRRRPTCEACEMFQCSCTYDARPKKRGPKTDVLESLVKRIDGLEKKLTSEKGSEAASSDSDQLNKFHRTTSPTDGIPPSLLAYDDEDSSPTVLKALDPSGEAPSAIDFYFWHIHGRSFGILDESTIREKHQNNQLSKSLEFALCAITTRFSNDDNDWVTKVRLMEAYAAQARAMVDVEEPSIEGLQTLLLVHQAFFAAGKGRKSYMVLTIAIGMAIAMDLHRHLDASADVTAVECETRKSLFWACYILDRFAACGTERPSLISDNFVVLPLPTSTTDSRNSSTKQYLIQAGVGQATEGGSSNEADMATLLEVIRILGDATRYLANGGVKTDSHLPWHNQSKLSVIRQALDLWASSTPETLSDVRSLFSASKGVAGALSKMIYHTIYCLIYRPFLAVNLGELQGTDQHNSWQIEATNLCFLHADAITDLACLARLVNGLEWPAFFGYCVFTAGTVHLHGAYYKSQHGEVYSHSSEYLTRDMEVILGLRYVWACLQHQYTTLQMLYGCHAHLHKTLSDNPLRYASAFHLEPFFDRYHGRGLDDAYIPFTEIDLQEIIEKDSVFQSDEATELPESHVNPYANLDLPYYDLSQSTPTEASPPLSKQYEGAATTLKSTVSKSFAAHAMARGLSTRLPITSPNSPSDASSHAMTPPASSVYDLNYSLPFSTYPPSSQYEPTSEPVDSDGNRFHHPHSFNVPFKNARSQTGSPSYPSSSYFDETSAGTHLYDPRSLPANYQAPEQP